MNLPQPVNFRNPFRPGAGHMPPYLAGREAEQAEFRRLLEQTTILENMVLTGLRGVGKTVLLETFKPIAIEAGWLWVGTDLSESTSVTEESLAIRLLTDLSAVSSSLVLGHVTEKSMSLTDAGTRRDVKLTYRTLTRIYSDTPGLVADKLKNVLEIVAPRLAQERRRGLIFAYDEAQNLADHAAKEQYPLSLLLDVFQSLQKKDIPFMLVLTGLPTLFPKLVEARTYAERMFRVVFLDQLSKEESRDAILKPIGDDNCPVTFSDDAVEMIIDISGGYPYFIQFVCREVYDILIQKAGAREELAVPLETILGKLDTDFFAGRWARATDRQRELLAVAAQLENSDTEFTVQAIVGGSKRLLDKPFSSSHANQMLATLCEAGLVYKNRYGKYSFAVPLLGQFIKRQLAQLGI